MSILRPKDGDYIVRGIFLLLCWTCVGWVPFAVLGGILAGAGGAAVGLCACLLGSPLLYGAYLRLDPKVYPQREGRCVCGHYESDHRSTLECRNGAEWRTTGHSTLSGSKVAYLDFSCLCLRYKKKHWWQGKTTLDPKQEKTKDCTCGHTRAEHKYGLACHNPYCDSCYTYTPRPWWRSRASYDPHNWSV